LKEFNSILASNHEIGMVYPKYSKNEIEGKVVKVYKLPGIKNKNIQ
jgi:HSP20 family molecular chaperone IbpA